MLVGYKGAGGASATEEVILLNGGEAEVALMKVPWLDLTVS